MITAFRLCGGPPKLRAAEWSRGSLLPRRVPMAFIKFSFSFSVSIHLKYRVNRWISRAPLGVKAYYYLYPPQMSFWVFVPLVSCPPGVPAGLWDSTGDAIRAGIGGSWVSVPLDLTRRAPRTPESTAVSHPLPCLLPGMSSGSRRLRPVWVTPWSICWCHMSAVPGPLAPAFGGTASISILHQLGSRT